MKTAASALVCLTLCSPVLAAGEWPEGGDPFYLAVQAPAAGGRTAFAYVRATPDRSDRTAWRVAVECGTMEAGTGRYLSRVTGTGRAERGRMRAVGGTVDLAGRPAGSFIFGLPEAGSLAVTVQFTDRRCPSGPGELSSGD